MLTSHTILLFIYIIIIPITLFYIFWVSYTRHLKSTQFLKCLAHLVGYRLLLGLLFFAWVLCLLWCQPSFIQLCIFFDIVPRAPITTSMTTTLTFQTFCNSILKSWYLTALMAMFWSPGIAKSIIWHSLICLLIQTMPGRLCSITISVWTLKSQRILYSSFSWTDCGVCVCVWVGGWVCVGGWVGGWVCGLVGVCVCLCTTCHCIVNDTSYTAISARRSQPCHGVFYVNF